MQVIATTGGVPVEYYVHAGAGADQTGRRGLAQDLPGGSVRYTDYVAEYVFEEATGCRWPYYSPRTGQFSGAC